MAWRPSGGKEIEKFALNPNGKIRPNISIHTFDMQTKLSEIKENL
jgi:hypothetical protein